MPNRILKESICTSDKVDSLSWFEEVLFYRLIVNCDDYGRFDGRIAVIKNRLFPLKDTLTLKAVSTAINKLASIGLVALYEFEGKPYLSLPTWNEHQNVRAKRSRYPSPEDAFVNTNACENMCIHVHSNVPVIQSESESESESKDSAEQLRSSTQQPVVLLPLNDGSEYAVDHAMVSSWEELYPAVDVMQQLRNMRGWLLSNPKKRKTMGGVERFISGWLAKEQDRGGSYENRGKYGGSNQPGLSAAERVEAGTSALDEFQRESIARMLKEHQKEGGGGNG